MRYRIVKQTAVTWVGIFLLQCISPILSMAQDDAKRLGFKHPLSKQRFQLSVVNGFITLDAENAELRSILDDIRKKIGLPIELYGNHRERITISFKDLPIASAINRISKNSGMVFSKVKGQRELQLSRVFIAESLENQRESRLKKIGENNAVLKSGHQNSNEFYAANNDSAPLVDNNGSNIKSTTNSNIVPHAVANELIVQFGAGVSVQEIEALVAGIGASIKDYIAPLNYYVLSLPANISVDRAMMHVKRMEQVRVAEPNALISLQAMPNDPLFSSQWALNPNIRVERSKRADVNMTAAWNLEQGNPGVVIAVIDTGMDYHHEDLAANVWHNPGEIPGNGIDDDHNGYIDDIIGWDFVDAQMGAENEDFTDPDNDPMDSQGHGTHVSGIAAAVGNNGLGIAGVAWNCKILPVRAAYRTKRWGAMLEMDDAARAIIYAAENGADVINISWGSHIELKLIESAIAFAADSGALVCTAAGNQNTNIPFYPAAYDNDAVIAVGATALDGNRAYMSNFGEWVDVFAPGVYIYSTDLSDQYTYKSGTSMAAALVSGIAGLVWSFNHDLTNYDVKKAIKFSSDNTESLRGDISADRVNVYKALVQAKSLSLY